MTRISILNLGRTKKCSGLLPDLLVWGDILHVRAARGESDLVHFD